MFLELARQIVAHIFGNKYYAVVLSESTIFNKSGEHDNSLSGYIFQNKEQARQYFYQMRSARTKQSVEIVSFRSRKIYKPFNNNYNVSI